MSISASTSNAQAALYLMPQWVSGASMASEGQPIATGMQESTADAAWPGACSEAPGEPPASWKAVPPQIAHCQPSTPSPRAQAATHRTEAPAAAAGSQSGSASARLRLYFLLLCESSVTMHGDRHAAGCELPQQREPEPAMTLRTARHITCKSPNAAARGDPTAAVRPASSRSRSPVSDVAGDPGPASQSSFGRPCAATSIGHNLPAQELN